MKRVVVEMRRTDKRKLIAVTTPGCQDGIGRALRAAYCETLKELPRELEDYLARLH